MTDEIEAFLGSYPLAVVRQVAVLRGLLRRAAPDAIERLRPGWRLIGYDLPVTRHGTYFAYIAPEPQHFAPPARPSRSSPWLRPSYPLRS